MFFGFNEEYYFFVQLKPQYQSWKHVFVTFFLSDLLEIKSVFPDDLIVKN
jgi:hypothetical protein